MGGLQARRAGFSAFIQSSFIIFMFAVLSLGCSSLLGGGSGPENATATSGSSGGNEGNNQNTASVELAFGTGFEGDETEPGRIGSGPGSNAKVIAHWNVVPFQTISGNFNVGVVAFHMNGIERVEFSLEGGPWFPVTDMTYNKRSKTNEYWAQIPASRSPKQGAIQVQAIAYPYIGQPRLLPRITLNVNEDKSLPSNVMYAAPTGDDLTGDGSSAKPFRTIMKAADAIQTISGGSADGGTVYLLEGSYSLGPLQQDQYGNKLPPLNTNTRWLTIESAPGANSSNVVLNNNGLNGLGTKLVHIKNLTVRTYLPTSGPMTDFLWLDGLELIGNGPLQDISVLGFVNGQIWNDTYATDTIVRDNKDALPLFSMLRNVKVYNLGSDAFTQSHFVVNCEVRGIDPKSSGFHSDVYQVLGNIDNVILYGVKAFDVQAQGLFSDDATFISNLAFVNVMIDKKTPLSAPHSQWQVPTDHLVIMGVTIYDQNFLWRSNSVGTKNVLVANSVFHQMSEEIPGQTDSFIFDNNHYIQSNFSFNPGTNVTMGNAGFEDIANENFKPAANSPLKNRVVDFFTAADVDNNPRIWLNPGGSIGAYE